MKVFFFGSDRRDPANVKLYKQIADVIEKLGHKVDHSWLESTTEKDSMEFEKAHKRNLNSIKNCDLVVVEVTEITSGVGFLISTALNEKKPVLALFNRGGKPFPSITLRGSSSANKLLSYKEYTDSDLESVVKEFVNKTKSLLDTKFILIISPQIDRYLEWASDQKRMHKAQLVREAVEQMLEKDKEYKNFLANN